MCGRYNLLTNLHEVGTLFGVTRSPDLPKRYNISPTQTVPIVRKAENGKRSIALVRWGLIPVWAKDPKIAFSMINARCETVATKPAYRTAFKKRRCLIPATGFYEWEKSGKQKLPHHFHLKDRQLFAFAGLWECWYPEKGDPLESCSIVTTEANKLVGPYHDRMPVILPRDSHDEWLDDKSTPDELQDLLKPFPVSRMAEDAVSTKVNSSRYDGLDYLAEFAAVFGRKLNLAIFLNRKRA
jgi:putative SOS response-associated peptidase YedK